MAVNLRDLPPFFDSLRLKGELSKRESQYEMMNSILMLLQQARLAARQGRANALPMHGRHQQAYSRPPSDMPMTEAQVVRKMNQRKSARKAEDSIRRQAGTPEVLVRTM